MAIDLKIEKWLQRSWFSVSLLLVLIFLGHSVVSVVDAHRTEAVLVTHSVAGHVSDADRVAPDDSPARSCDVDHAVSVVPGQSRPVPLLATDAVGPVVDLASVICSGPIVAPDVPPLSGALLRSLLQVFLN